MIKLGSKELRHSTNKPEGVSRVKRNPIYLVLDSVTDTYNIGSLFRLADAVAAEKLYVCGEVEYPPSSRIHKAAVGTESWVSWEKKSDATEIVKELKNKGVQIISVEQNIKSIDYGLLTTDKIHFPLAIVVGNETTGVSRSVLDSSDIIVELPMFGVNKSFNVWGSAAVVCYKILESINP
ncbi:TrmH family RNA methyltransferase [Candidatus Woesebacteria bacterium]|nr:TrmH family RNA methyltransferase [Candidatus Woesebacteria bacterium]